MGRSDTEPLVLPDEAEYPRELTRDYELVECFARSEASETLLAMGRKDRRPVTVKCMYAGNVLYDAAEPEALKSLNAPPLPRFICEYKNSSMRCIVREYIPGETLAELAEHKKYTRQEIAQIGILLCGQLHSLHTAPIPVIHRDIKPQNIIIREDGTPVLIDFSISRELTDKPSDTVVFGTRGYAPPEQYGYSSTDERSDLYSLGMVLSFLLYGTGKRPGQASDALDKAILRMTAFDPDRRCKSALQAKRLLERALPGHRLKQALVLAAVLVLALAGAAAGAIRLTRPQAERAVFSHPLVESAVRQSLGIPEGTPVTKDMLQEVRGIYIVADRALPDADGFYRAVGEWYAAGRSGRGTLEDLNDLAAMPALEQCCVAAQQLTDISALKGLKHLGKAELKHNLVQDISAFSDMDRLTSVGLNGNPVRDISPLLSCPNLAFLDLCDVRTYDASLIAQMGNFDYLDLANPTDSYRYLEGKSILSLSLSWSGITDLACLDTVTRLETLDISHTSVSDLTPLSVHRNLKALKITAIPAEDLSPLLSLPLLESVTLSTDMEPLAGILQGTSVKILYE